MKNILLMAAIAGVAGAIAIYLVSLEVAGGLNDSDTLDVSPRGFHSMG